MRYEVELVRGSKSERVVLEASSVIDAGRKALRNPGLSRYELRSVRPHREPMVMRQPGEDYWGESGDRQKQYQDGYRVR